MPNDLPKTVAERNKDLVDFWNSGYDFALKTALDQIHGEALWQTELGMRGNPHSGVIVERLEVLAKTLQDFREVVKAQAQL